MAHNDVGDIRAVSAAEHWSHFEHAWTKLLSYRYLGKETPHLDKGVTREVMPLRHDMRNCTGGVMAAPLCIASPEPWWLDDDCVPAPVAMSYDILDPARDVQRIEVLREVIGIGRTMGFSRARIVDADNPSRVIAISTGTGVSLGDVPPGFEPIDNPVYELEDVPELPALREVFGVEPGADGAMLIDRVTPELSSPHGALHIGPINIALEAAAMDELERSTGRRDVQVEHWTVLLVKPGYRGPFRATATVVGGGRGPRLGIEATMTDQGHHGRVIATVSASFRLVDQM
jgi:acyl-coenzyme A thioesterase PaaI-like protein